VKDLEAQCAVLRQQLKDTGALTIIELEERRHQLEETIASQTAGLAQQKAKAEADATALEGQIEALRETLVATEETALLQEVGVYEYRHPLADAVAYRRQLDDISSDVKAMCRKDGGAVLATTSWKVNGSAADGRAMVRDFSKLMLRAFNAEADDLVKGLKPHKLDSALRRLEHVASTIERLGRSMFIHISAPYLKLRQRELELTADFLQKQAEEKEVERHERERMRDEKKAQREMERERLRLEKERQHYTNVIETLTRTGDEAGAERVKTQLADVEKAIADVDYRAANVRAGYVYVISNIGSFGERMVKIGMTRRLDPHERVKELGDASVPFNFDVHALFFSKDAVGIEHAMHERLATDRVNLVNRRREFFRVTPGDVKDHLAELAGELLQFQETPEALEYRQCLAQAKAVPARQAGPAASTTTEHPA
jgi:hypothetical protein